MFFSRTQYIRTVFVNMPSSKGGRRRRSRKASSKASRKASRKGSRKGSRKASRKGSRKGGSPIVMTGGAARMIFMGGKLGVGEGYCVKCRKARQMQNPHEKTMKNGRKMLQGSCAVCGTKISRILGSK